MTEALPLGSEEREKLAQLRRVKALATGVLALCLVVLFLTKWLETHYPALAYVAAFAEAATIGGLADWYAVVALFRRPLGLPIPHTAIIPENQQRIADNLGRFIEQNFLASDTVRARLEDIDFADEIADWLSNERRSRELALFLARLMPQMLDSLDQSGLKDFAAERINTQLHKTEVAPMAAKLLDVVVKDGRHNRLLDDLLVALNDFLNDEKALEAIKRKVQEELPSLLYIFQAEGVILRRIVRAASELLAEVRDDPEHEMRAEFERFLKSYLERIKQSKRFADRVEQMKNDILDRPEFGEIAERMWRALRRYLEADLASDDPETVRRLSEVFIDVGRTLRREKALKKRIDKELRRFIAGFIEQQKASVSAFISSQVKSWDFTQLVLLIEANIGKDLQYIRFNGMVIGGIAGLTLHILLVLIGWE